jgi:outer membrane receptor protein involved in Fe transport
MKTLLSAAVAAMLALGAMSATADAMTGEGQVPLVIESKSLAEALDAWAKQTGYRIFVPNWELAKSLPAPTLKGSFAPRAALEKLLDGSPLTWVLLKERSVLVREKAPSSPAKETPHAKDQQPALHIASGYADGAPDRPEEIIVTAQKREERLRDVPISITVLGGADLDRSTVQGISEALNRVPGVVTTIAQQSGGTQIAIRGVTAGGPLFNGSSPIAYYIDSMPFGLIKTAIGPDSSAYDLKQIEVLRGPQGTLYGASAQNGVVRVLTQDVNLQDLEFKARTSASGTAEGGTNYRGDVALNVPLAPGKVAARMVLGYSDFSGWIDKPVKSDVNDAQLRNVRLKVNAQTSENLSVGLSAWRSQEDYGAPSVSDDHLRQSSLADESIATEYDVYGVKIDYEFPAVSVSSRTSYIDYTNEGTVDFTPAALAAPLFTGLYSKVAAEELIVNSTQADLWRWSIGAMYRDAQDLLRQRFPGVIPAPIGFTETSKSLAVFGQLTRRFMNGKLELTAGLRHFEDDVTGRENIRVTGVPTEPLIHTRSTFEADSPRFVVTLHPADALTLYASYAEGFRSGFNQHSIVLTTAPGFPPLKADNLINYEVGAKGTAWNGRVTFDSALFYMDWEHVQQTLTVNFNGAAVTALVNGQSASGAGFEFAVMGEPIEGLQLGANFSWNDLQMDAAVFSGGALLFDKGDRLNLSSEYTAGVSIDYEVPLGRNGYSGRFSTSANYASEQDQRTVVSGVQRSGKGDDMFIARASFTLDFPDRWSATLLADNITNETDSPVRDSTGVADWSMRVRPRTIGVQVEYSF